MCCQSAVSADLQEYFFPKEDTTVKQRQQQWVKSVALRRKSAAVLGEADKAAFPAAPSRFPPLGTPHKAPCSLWLVLAAPKPDKAFCCCYLLLPTVTCCYLLLPAAYGKMLH